MAGKEMVPGLYGPIPKEDADAQAADAADLRKKFPATSRQDAEDQDAGRLRSSYAKGGCVTARGAATMAKLRARHGKDV